MRNGVNFLYILIYTFTTSLQVYNLTKWLVIIREAFIKENIYLLLIKNVKARDTVGSKNQRFRDPMKTIKFNTFTSLSHSSSQKFFSSNSSNLRLPPLHDKPAIDAVHGPGVVPVPHRRQLSPHQLVPQVQTLSLQRESSEKDRTGQGICV